MKDLFPVVAFELWTHKPQQKLPRLPVFHEKQSIRSNFARKLPPLNLARKEAVAAPDSVSLDAVSVHWWFPVPGNGVLGQAGTRSNCAGPRLLRRHILHCNCVDLLISRLSRGHCYQQNSRWLCTVREHGRQITRTQTQHQSQKRFCRLCALSAKFNFIA